MLYCTSSHVKNKQHMRLSTTGPIYNTLMIFCNYLFMYLFTELEGNVSPIKIESVSRSLAFLPPFLPPTVPWALRIQW